ncbi:threonine-phosphate decarboxylase CobD [Pseudomonas turukhanskensis]|uniref:threonine-phosphate decarboxylase n=1 Tax=Pseudomonas turukhanskensis TaxID=1806536 RepID=A0A9W6K9B7_9PSED|nr:threonine-phosphate decarboxylase CobD [Pseudomonas turukhanskensis]GLK89839.1 threonine-phosphate decarboxylase [Pseudomonas turukhanskensis]
MPKPIEGGLEHGGRLQEAAREYGIAVSKWLDLSTGIAPWPFAVPAIPVSAWARLPESGDGLHAAACAYYGVTQLLAVAGSQAAIQMLPRLRAHSRVGVLSPCYGEHAHAWRQAGHDVMEIADAEVQAHLANLDVLVVVNPNNPTGRLCSREQLLAWHSQLVARGGWLLVDEAFIDITPEHSLAAATPRDGLIVLRSFGKFFGLAGARLGCVLAVDSLLQALAERLGPWTINGPTRTVAAHCFADLTAQQQQRERALAASQRLAALMAAHGLQPTGGCGLFQWWQGEHAAALHDFFARQGILLRLFPAHSSVRVGLPANEAQWQRLAWVLQAWAMEFVQ